VTTMSKSPYDWARGWNEASKKAEGDMEAMSEIRSTYNKKGNPFDPYPYEPAQRAAHSKEVERDRLMEAEANLLDVADELARRTLWDVDSMAADLSAKRFLRMSVEELDASKKAAFEKNESDMALREADIVERENDVVGVEQEQAAREDTLVKKLETLTREKALLAEEVGKSRSTLKKVMIEISDEKSNCRTMVARLKDSLHSVQALEAKYGELDKKASSFVDDNMMAFFGEEEDEV
jgi:hypothetical protein